MLREARRSIVNGRAFPKILIFSTIVKNALPKPRRKTRRPCRTEGLDIVWQRREPAIYTAEIRSGDERTHLEWVVDSDFRFFPTVKDELFGYMIHPIDLATNKVMAAAGRQKAADAVDLLTIHEHVLPLGAVIWAAVEKAPGYTPEGLIAEIRRNATRYREEDLRAVPSNEVIDPKILHSRLRAVLDEAEAFVLRMPTEKIGLLFLKDGKVVQPDPGHLDDYTTHAGQAARPLADQHGNFGGHA